MKDFNTMIDGTETTSATKKIHFLCTMLCGEALREFNNLEGQVAGTTNFYLKFIKEGLRG